MLGEFAVSGDFAHVFSDVEVGLSRDWAACSACSALNALEKFVFLSEFLGVHAVHHFYVKWEHKIIKAFSCE